jgi:hypothetical protein
MICDAGKARIILSDSQDTCIDLVRDRSLLANLPLVGPPPTRFCPKLRLLDVFYLSRIDHGPIHDRVLIYQSLFCS